MSLKDLLTKSHSSIKNPFFTEEDFEELLRSSEISNNIDYQNKKIIIDINIKSPPTSKVWESIWRVSKNKFFILNIKNCHLNYLITAYTNIPFEFNEKENSLIFNEKENSSVPTHIIGDLLFLIFQRQISISFEPPSIEIPKPIFWIFDKEEKIDQKGNKKFRVGISDDNEYYWLSLSNNNVRNNEELFSKLVINNYYEVDYSLLNASSKYSEYIDGFLMDAKEFISNSNLQYADNMNRKIYNFCIHTKNSAFDGLYTAKEFVEQAQILEHKFIGVSDLFSVQGYSDLEKSAKESGIKPIYGTEFELRPEDYPIVINENNFWDGSTICIFDIETTGLNPAVDDLIQISISKYVDEEKESSYDCYVKTDKFLQDHIIELTKITQEKIDSEGRDLVEVLQEVKEFIKGSLLIAHNGIVFDLPFLNSKLRLHNMEIIDNPLLDPMRLSQALFISKNFKFHSLSAISKKSNLTYKEEEAHNASYDVTILSQCFFKYLLIELKKQNYSLKTLSTLNTSLFSKNLFNYYHGNNVLTYIKNQNGVKNQYELISKSHTEFLCIRPRITKKAINSLRDGLIVVSPPINSEIISAALNNDEERFVKAAEFYDYIIIPPPCHFDFEINSNQLTKEESVSIISKIYSWCSKYQKPYLLNSAVRYLSWKDYERYLVLINTKGLSGRKHYLYNSKFKSSKYPVFDLKNTTNLINKYSMVENYEALIEGAYHYQDLFLNEIEDNIEVIKKTLHPPTIANIDSVFKKNSYDALKKIYGDKPDKYVLDRYESELKSIEENNYFVIYWVSHLLVESSIKNGYLVGSRGSVGSSFVAYLMNISEVNPLPPHYYCTDCSYFELVSNFLETGFDLPEQMCVECNKKMKSDGHNIPFETFLGFDGNKVPDIDLNFSGEYQSKAHNFLKDFFGQNRVFRAGTISTMADKTAYAVVKEYFEENDRKYTQGRLRWLISKLVDVKRTSGQHPGGILVVPSDKSIYEFTPTNWPANDFKSEWLTTHFEFEDLHDSLLKFDLLGHDDPTTLAKLKELTKVDPSSISYSDKKIMELYGNCEVLGIEKGSLVNNDDTGAIALPEFGTLLTRKIIKACNPKSFADLVRISGFSHGTGVWKNNIDKLIKEGKSLNSVITCRDDIMIYLLSKGLSRKDAFNISEDIRKGKGVSRVNLKLLKQYEVPDWYIDSAKKISYIFPKAHATAYVLMSWKIAFYKLYYPLAFYSVYFSLSAQFFDWETLSTNNSAHIMMQYQNMNKTVKTPNKQSKFKDKRTLVIYEVALEFLARGFKFKNVDLNKSSWDKFLILEEEKSLLLPLIVIDGLGEIKAKAIEDERTNGEYIGEEDLIERTTLNKKIIEVLREKRIINF